MGCELTGVVESRAADRNEIRRPRLALHPVDDFGKDIRSPFGCENNLHAIFATCGFGRCAGTIEARYWQGADLAAETAAVAEVENVIVFGSDQTVEAVRSRMPSSVQFTGHGARYSVGLVMPDAELRRAADDAAVDVCMFDQAGCKSPQTIYVVGDTSRALRFAQALDGSLRNVSVRLPRMRPSRDEAAAAIDVLRRSYLTALDAPNHSLSPILRGPDNGACPDYVIVVEPQGPPRTYGFGRIVVIMPLAEGMPPVLSGAIEEVGIAGGFESWPQIGPMLCGADERDELVVSALGMMQRSVLAQPYAYDFLRHPDDGALR